MRLLTLLLLAVYAASARGAGEALVEEFRELSSQIPYLNVGAAIYDRQPGRGYRGKLLSDREAAAVAGFWERAHAAPVDSIRAALADGDAKVRAMGLLAAYWSGEPQRWLPQIVAMVGDEGEAFPALSDRSAAFMPLGDRELDAAELRKKERFETQTVGTLANEIARTYLSASGYSYGIKGSPPRHPGFSDYWEKRRDRDYGLGWFKVALNVASEGSSSIGGRQREKIAALRARIDALPSPDREWVLLSLATPWEGGAPEPGGSELAGEKDLVAAVERLGKDSIMALFRRHQISDDPDMALDGDLNRSAFQYDRVTLFALRHPKAVFGRGDAEILLGLANTEEGARFATPRWWTAAADLAPERAGEILRAARERFAEGDSTYDQDSRAMIAVAMWQHLGAEAIPEIADWFFGDEPSRGAGGFGRHRLCDFMWGRGRHELLVAILRDDRMAQLDWGTLAYVVRSGIAHSDAPPVDADEYRKAWHPYGVSHYHWQREKAAEEHPKETAGLEATLASWREKLRGYAEKVETEK